MNRPGPNPSPTAAQAAAPGVTLPPHVQDDTTLAEAAPARLDAENDAAPPDPGRLADELRVHQIDLELQDELQRIQRELDAERDRYYELYDLTPVAYLTLAPNGSIEQANLACASLLGVPREALTTRLLSQFVDPADADRFHLLRTNLSRDPAPQQCELRVCCGSAVIWVLLSAAARRSGDAGTRRLVLSDITTQKQAAQTLIERELERGRLDLAISASRTLLLDIDLLTGQVTIHGRSAGAAPAEPRLRPIEKMLAVAHPDDAPGLRQFYDDACRGRAEILDAEVRAARRDGKWTWRHLHVRVIGHDPVTRRPSRMVCASVDIDSRKRAELALIELNRDLEQRVASRTEALAEREAHLRAVMRGAPVGILVVMPDDRIVEANPRACEILGYSESTLLALDVKTITHPDDWPVNADLRARMKAGQLESFKIEKRYLRRNGEVVWAQLTVAGVNDARGRHRHRISVIEDITERRLAQAREQRQANQLSALSGRLLRAQEDERRQLAHELHDEIGQVLTGVHMALGAAEQAGTKTRRGELLLSARQAVSDAIVRVRRLWLRLRPPVLDDLGLVAAMQGLCRQHEELTSMRVEFHAEVQETALRPAVGEAIYRICQESLNNVARHSRASAVEIRLRVEDAGELVLTVRDNGVGFDPLQTVSDEQLGIVGMRERARALGSTLQVQPGSHGGTEVRAQFVHTLLHGLPQQPIERLPSNLLA